MTNMLVIEGLIQIVAVIFLDVISFDCFYANSRSCYDVDSSPKTICYFQPISANTPMTWEDAWSVCKEHNYTLPVIENRLIEETLKKHIKATTSLTYQMWLAGGEIRTDRWHWLNGQPFGQQNASQGPPLTSDMHVTNVVIKEFRYMPTYASYEKYYICQYTDSKLCQNTSVIHWAKGCLFANNYEQLKLVDARNRCLDEGGDLATFEEDEQLTTLQQNSSFLNKEKSYWIGLRFNWWIWNATAGSKEIKYSNWAVYLNQPNRPCLYIRLHDYKWEQSDCAAKKPFLCQTVNTTENTQGTDVESCRLFLLIFLSTVTTTANTQGTGVEHFLSTRLPESQLDVSGVLILTVVSILVVAILLVVVIVAVIIWKRKVKTRHSDQTRVETDGDYQDLRRGQHNPGNNDHYMELRGIRNQQAALSPDYQNISDYDDVIVSHN